MQMQFSDDLVCGDFGVRRKITNLGIFLYLLACGGGANAQGMFELECLLEPHSITNVGTPVPGVLASVDVQRGDIVKKGQVVARVDSRLEQAAVELARARSQYAERRVERSQELYEDDLLSGQERDELETERLLAQLELRQAVAQVEIRTIRSPIDGVVIERALETGEFVLDAAILTLAEVNPINVEVVVPVAYYGQIEVGDTAYVKPEEPLGGRLPARVSVVDKVVDAASGTFGVRLAIKNDDLGVPAGLRCMVEFDARRE